MIQLLFGLFFSFARADDIFPGSYSQLLKETVEISSASDSQAGNEAVRRKFIPAFKKLGFQTRSMDLIKGRKLLVFDFKDAVPTTLMVGHVDTVFPKDNSFKAYKVENGRITGPGVADMKGGIIMMLQAMANLNHEQLKKIRIVLNDDEEIGSPDSRALMRELAKDVANILIFEPDIEGKLATSHPGGLWLNIDVKGQAAHAGENHRLGVNACVELSYKIIEIAKLTEYKKGLTFNAGVISGGSKPNVVCDHATVRIDMRYRKISDRDESLKKINAIVAKSTVYNKETKQGTTATMTTDSDNDVMTPEATRELFGEFQKLAASIGVKYEERTKGGIDSYGLALPGKKILSGLGAVGNGYHSDQEYLDIARSGEKVKVLQLFLQKLLQ